MASRLILLRHGDTGAGDRYLGSSDLPLIEKGREQIRNIALYLQQIDIDAVWVSPMQRCRETLDLLALPNQAQIVNDLREVDFGRWEGLSFAEIAVQDRDLVNKWAADGAEFTFPGGDSVASFNERIAEIAHRLCNSDCSTLLVVSHGGVIRGLICRLLGLNPDQYLLFQQALGCYTVLDLHGHQGVMVGFNLGGHF